MELPATFGEWLRHSRAALRLTRAELADRVGCSVAMLRKIETGDRRPSRQIAELIANSLDVPIDDRPTFVRVARGELSIDRLLSITPRISVLGRRLALSLPHNNLPVLPNPLIGRQRDIDRLSELLRDPQCRLLTLVGAGGIGKTRLAIETASQMQEFFTDGVFFVPLANASSPRFILPLIADAIGFAFQRDDLVDPKTQLFSYLHEKHALLLLDNLEQLLAEPGIELLAELLEHTLRMTLLITSRASLDLYSEWVFEVQGLPVPESDLTTTTTSGTSVELFLLRARRANLSFNATQEDYPAIVRICRLVDGMPLGIELAAAWVRTLSCQQIAQEIERGLDFLDTSLRDLPARHRSMRAIFEQSWRLLSDEEQGVLLRLSVFQGGFQRDAAEAVAGAVLSALSAFVAKSLIRRSSAGRYDLHELIRQYAFDRLSRQPEEIAQMQARHGRYYLNYLRGEDHDLRSPAQREAIARVTVEMDNIRVAWDWAILHGEFALVEQALRAFATFFDNRGWFQDGLGLLGRAIGALEAASQRVAPVRLERVALGHLLTCQGLLLFRLAQNEQAQAVLERSLDILRPLHEPRVLVESLSFLGIVMTLKGEIARALDLLSEGLETAKEIGDRWWMALCLTEQVNLNLMQDETENAYERMRFAVGEWRAIGDPRFTAFALNFLSFSAFKLGLYSEARRALEESIALNRSVGDRWGLGSAYRGLGLIAQAQGEHTRALNDLQQSQGVFTELGARWDIARVLTEMGRSVFALGDDREAERIWRGALRLSTEIQATAVGLEALTGLAALRARHGDLKTAYEWLLVILDHPATYQEIKNRASRLRNQLADQMGPEEIKTLQWRAGTMTFASLVDELLQQAGNA